MMQDYVSLMSLVLIVSFLEGLVAKYWILSNIFLSVQVSSTVNFLCGQHKYDELLLLCV